MTSVLTVASAGTGALALDTGRFGYGVERASVGVRRAARMAG
jgi:hypothetical protein